MAGLNGLQSWLYPYAAALIQVANAAGIPLFASSVLRSAAEQNRLYQQGRTRPGPIVTAIDGYQRRSRHQEGRAFDVDVRGYRRSDVPKWVWDALGKVWEQAGGRWGGRWGDYGHFEA